MNRSSCPQGSQFAPPDREQMCEALGGTFLSKFQPTTPPSSIAVHVNCDLRSKDQRTSLTQTSPMLSTFFSIDNLSVHLLPILPISRLSTLDLILDLDRPPIMLEDRRPILLPRFQLLAWRVRDIVTLIIFFFLFIRFFASGVAFGFLCRSAILFGSRTTFTSWARLCRTRLYCTPTL